MSVCQKNMKNMSEVDSMGRAPKRRTPLAVTPEVTRAACQKLTQWAESLSADSFGPSTNNITHVCSADLKTSNTQGDPPKPAAPLRFVCHVFTCSLAIGCRRTRVVDQVLLLLTPPSDLLLLLLFFSPPLTSF